MESKGSAPMKTERPHAHQQQCSIRAQSMNSRMNPRHPEPKVFNTDEEKQKYPKSTQTREVQPHRRSDRPLTSLGAGRVVPQRAKFRGHRGMRVEKLVDASASQ